MWRKLRVISWQIVICSIDPPPFYKVVFLPLCGGGGELGGDLGMAGMQAHRGWNQEHIPVWTGCVFLIQTSAVQWVLIWWP